MPTWEGWTAASAHAASGVPTWEEWCTRQQRIRDTMKHR